MKISVASDLHLEFGSVEIKNHDQAAILILSGDIVPVHCFRQTSQRRIAQSFRDLINQASKDFEHVIYVAGNHEFYHGSWTGSLLDLRLECAQWHNVHFLERETVTLQDTLFVGGTLWTNMNKGDPLTLHAVRDMINDFKIIHNDNHGRHLTPQDTVDRHDQTVDFFRCILEHNPHTNTVIVTHHAPSTLSIHKQYQGDTVMNGAYCSDLSQLMLDHDNLKLWTHGHMHTTSDYTIGQCRVICNPRGYLGWEARAHDWQLVTVELD
jgi:Icc-related predicted phosphoesterase